MIISYNIIIILYLIKDIIYMNETLLLYRCFKISCIYIYIEIDTKI